MCLILSNAAWSRVAEIERHAGHDHAIEKALEHRRQAEAPGWELQDERFGRGEPRHVAFETRLVARGVVIMAAPIFRQNRIEFFRVEIEQIDLVAGTASAASALVLMAA